MILYLLISIAYIAALLLITPAPPSLKEAKPTIYQNFQQTKAALFTGLFLLFIFFVTSNFKFLEADQAIHQNFALRIAHEGQEFWPLPILTHTFLHINLVHVLANVFSIGLASVYERRVGVERFTKVIVIASLASIPSAFFYPDDYFFCGISGGVLGLAAAYFTDHEKMTLKEWVQSIAFFIFVFAALSIGESYKMSSYTSLNFHVDHIGHIFGAIAAIAYCRAVPRST